MTLWDVLQKKGDDIDNVFDMTVDACATICYIEPDDMDDMDTCLMELYKRVEVAEKNDDLDDVGCKFYEFFEANEKVFDRHFENVSGDLAADITEKIDYLTAGYMSEKAYKALGDDIKTLPLPPSIDDIER